MMTKKLALLVGPVLLITAAIASGAGEETPSIKDVMKLNKGAKSPLAQLKTKLSEETPDWAGLEKLSKEFVDLTAALVKNDPPKGDAASWKKLSDAYHAEAKALADAAKSKDKAAAVAAQKKLATSCKSCHSVHKG